VATAGTGTAEPPADGPTFANGAIEAEELADFLGIITWAFTYDGGSPLCWVEVTEEGQKTVSQPRILEVKTAQAGVNSAGGKILLLVKPGDIQLRVNSRVARGGAGIGLPQDALWWGWKAYSGSTTRLQRPVALKEGHEIMLLRYDVEEPKSVAKDAQHPRKVHMVVKAAAGKS
jgi:hypothetical protein